MALTIRKTGKADLASVDALLATSYARQLKEAYPPSILVTALPDLSRAQPRLVASGRYYGVWDGDDLVGAGGWSLDKVVRHKGHVRHVVTDYRRARRRIGTALLSHILEAARAEGMREMECWATRNAEPFYASLGFQSLRPIEVPLQPGITFPSILMRMGLA